MAKKHHLDADAIIASAMALAAERGWRGLALADIAHRANVSMTDLVDRFSGKTAILDAYARSIDRRMMEGTIEAEENPRDRLFDVVMRRFEAMAPDRRALAIILRDTGTDPWAMACGARRFTRSMALALETAGISTSSLIGLARIEGLAAVHLYVMKVFLDDDSPDLSKTMTALDKALRQAESAAAALWRRPVPHSTAERPAAPS